MLIFGFVGETGGNAALIGAIVTAAIYTLSMKCSLVKLVSQCFSGNAAAQSAFNTIRWIVTVGWAIYLSNTG